MNRRLLLSLAFTLSTSAVAADLRGLALIGADGTFLGTCDGVYGATSITNTSSPYGNPASPTSIYNPRGPYGSVDGTYSAFRTVLSQPPYLVGVEPDVLEQLTRPGFREPTELLKALEASPTPRITVNRTSPFAFNPTELREACQNL